MMKLIAVFIFSLLILFIFFISNKSELDVLNADTSNISSTAINPTSISKEASKSQINKDGFRYIKIISTSVAQQKAVIKLKDEPIALISVGEKVESIGLTLVQVSQDQLTFKTSAPQNVIVILSKSENGSSEIIKVFDGVNDSQIESNVLIKHSNDVLDRW